MDDNHSVRIELVIRSLFRAEKETHVMMITTTFSHIAKFARKERRCKVRICPRIKPKSMKITSATMTGNNVRLCKGARTALEINSQHRNPLPFAPAAI